MVGIAERLRQGVNGTKDSFALRNAASDQIDELAAALDDAYRAICHIKFDRDLEPALAAAKDRARAILARIASA